MEPYAWQQIPQELVQFVRRRPGMYVGSTGADGVAHLAVELVDNVLDEHLAGHARTLDVRHGVDGIITVSDDGRGIPEHAILEVCTSYRDRPSWDGPQQHSDPALTRSILKLLR